MEPAEARRRDSPLALTMVLAAFLGTLALNWPALPFNVRIADLIFPAVILTLVVAHRLATPKLHWLDGLVLAYVAGSLPSFLASSENPSVVEMTRIGYLALIYAVTATVVAFGYLRITILSLVVGAFVLAAIGLGFALLRSVVPVDVQALSESMTIPYAGEVVRLRALTASPAMLACVLTVAVPFAMATWLRGTEISGGTVSKPQGGSCPRTAPAVLGAKGTVDVTGSSTPLRWKTRSGDPGACAAAGAPRHPNAQNTRVGGPVRPRPAASEVLKRVGSTRLLLIALAIACAAALLTFSHAVVGLMAAMVIVLWPRLHSRHVLRGAAVALVVLVAMLANVTLVAAVRSITLNGNSVTERGSFHHAVEDGSVQLGDLRVDYEVMSYFRIKQLAVGAFVSSPWTGIGLDRFHEVTSAAHQQGRLPATYREIDPHSTLLGRLAETGILGGITLVALWIGFLVTASLLSQVPGERGWIARAALAALAGLLITSINVDVMNFRFLWAAFGVVRGLDGSSGSGEAS